MTPVTWPRRRIGDCAKFLSGGTPRKSHSEYWEGEIPWVSSGEMGQRFIYDTPLHISEEAAGHGSRLIPENTVLVVVRGMSLAKEFRVSLTKREVAFNQDLKALQCEPDIDSRFLFYSLLSHRESIRDLASEASHGTKRLETDVLTAFEISVPRDMDIQRRVVEVICNYDELIENNRRRIALLEDAARQLYCEWFVRLRFPGYEHSAKTNGVPNGWQRLPLECALVLQRGFDLPTQAREDGMVPVYGSTGIVGKHNIAKVTGPGIVTGRSGSLGSVHFVAEDFWPLNTALWVKEFRLVTPLYALFLLQEMDLRQYNGGASVPTLDRKAVHRIEVLIPRKQLITAFDEFASPIFTEITNLTIQNQKLCAVRDLLLPRLMSGEIAV